MFPRVAGLLIFTFHSLFESEQEARQDLLDPQQAITVAMFRAFVKDFIDHGYRFVSPGQIASGLDSVGQYAMITFDDGYANNLRALPVLEEFGVPAVFCIAANHVAMGKPFWWDVLYREAKKRKWPGAKLNRARVACKHLQTPAAEALIMAEFGIAAFHVESDLDRPFSGKELADFARRPLIHIGNHTWDHAILTNYPAQAVHQQIRHAQEWLREVTGKTPAMIAYPNGNSSPEIAQAARSAGLELGVTVHPGRNAIARLATVYNLALRRNTLWGHRDIALQCRVARSRFSLQSATVTIRSKFAVTA